jgi:hypothetical protein
MKKLIILLLLVFTAVFVSSCTLDAPGWAADHWSKKNRDARQ